ncbi:GW dipeptide domain-containing protein, partial [Marinilactibacillus psychrotolerans]|uniref:GW dipeptide domain-containing protein n=1 Tax=Marinilactibacillus psychrotolerans TaxID=191770 RepID=UPI0038874434
VTDRATWALVSIGKKEIGWIDKAALDIEKVTSEKSVSYTRFINRTTDTITSKPYGTEGYEIVNKSKNYFGEQVKVLKEAKTRRATWVLISINDKEIGWIDQGALTTNEVIISEKEINYVATINRGTDTINTNPYGTFESKYVAHSSKYLNKQVKVIKEAVTGRATWALISVGGKQIGWIDKEALNIEKVTSEKSVQYTRYISRMTDGINTKPYGTEGYSTVAKSSAYFGKKVQVIKEATTQRATWALISIDGKQLGWIDKAALSEFEVIISEKDINYYALIKRDSDSITTKPYGTKDYETITKSSQYLNKEVKITKEAVTDRATWAYITINGKNVGWIDKAALDIERVTSETNVADYKARIIRKGDSISSEPWGTEGYVVKSSSSNYFGTEVTVKKEAKTRRATWVLIALNGKELGWIDKAALKKLDPNKRVVVIDAGHGGSDPGAQAGGVKEKDLNLTVSKKVQTKLKNAGYEVIMTRSTDVFVELSERARIANTSSADIFVSIHTNSFNSTANGIETYSYNGSGTANNPIVAKDPDRLLKSSLLSEAVQDALLDKTGASNRGDKKANFHVIRETGMPAILTEMGFIDNSAERAKLVKDSYQNQIADGIVLGIKEYFKIFK